MYNTMIMLIDITRNELDQLLYVAPLSYSEDDYGNKYIIFRSQQKCTFIVIDNNQKLKHKIKFDFADAKYSSRFVSSVSFAKGYYKFNPDSYHSIHDIEPISFFVGFKDGSIAKITSDDNSFNPAREIYNKSKPLSERIPEGDQI
jgi:hypothetical protein